ncbi:MAG: B12-binding domain-containing radical SAM protein [Spirochaetota bacterium]
MKIVFVQLPLLDHGCNYIAGNMGIAPATLQAFCLSNYRTNINAVQLPPTIQNFGSDPIIVDAILHHEPTHVAFTCYLWNVERSLEIAKKIKSLSPHTIILFGGPEIQRNFFLMTQKQPYIDYFIIGEGEFFFMQYFANTHSEFLYSINANSVFIQPPQSFVQLKQMVEPYTSGFLQPMFDNSMSVEIIRGCPFKCNYCLYSKNAHRIRAFSPQVLSKIIHKAKNDSIEEIYLLAPTFNQSSRFYDYLSTLIELKNTVPLHTEVRADTITKDIALILKKANFKSFEVGLQTLNQHCLQKIGRKTKPLRELDGIQYLQEAGFTLQIGIIPGLPYDTPHSFYTTLETLLDKGLGNEIELYPLMVLPGTNLYDLAKKHRATFMEKPPYYFIEGFNFSHDDLLAITHYFEDTTGFTFNPPFIPSFIFKKEGKLIGSAYVDLNKHTNIPFDVFNSIETNHFIFFLASDSSLKIKNAISTILNCFSSETLLCSLVLIHDHILDDQKIGALLLQKTKDTFYYRMMYFNEEYDRLPIRVFQVFEDYSTFLQAVSLYQCIKPILKVSKQNIALVMQQTFPYPYPIVVETGLVSMCLEWLVKNYHDSHELVSFEDEADQKIFFDSISLSYKQTIQLRTIFI